MEVAQIALLLSETLSPDLGIIRGATDALDRLSSHPQFPFALLHIATGNQDQGQKIAAATYLKNLSCRNIEGEFPYSKLSKEFKDELLRALFQVEPRLLKVLVEVFRIIVGIEFVKQKSWPELVSDLHSAIQSSNLINNGAGCQLNAINVLTVLCATCRPFQYFLNPKDSKEPVPPQLELLAHEIIVPLLAVFHHLVEKALGNHDGREMETDKILLIVCKCMYYSVRSHMPSALASLLPLFCHNLISILDSFKFEAAVSIDGNLSRLKTGKRSLLIFCIFVTRHRKYSDKLMPDIIKCAMNIVKYSENVYKLDFLSERIISLAFDVISHVLETGRGWRLISPHFSMLIHSAIFPSLVMNEKDVFEWEEDPDEYLRKNLPSELEEVSGWREDLYTARKSATNLLGVIAMSKGPPTVALTNGSPASSKRKKGNKRTNNQRTSIGELVVLPFLLKYPIPCDANASQTCIANDYYGVLIAYCGLLDFLREQQPKYVAFLIRTRVLPLYAVSMCLPFLVASANWVLGELASCLPEEVCADVYSSLVKALSMPDKAEMSFYPVRVSAAGAIAKLLENDYLPLQWLPLLQVVIGGIGQVDEENSILFQLLSSVVEAGNENVAIHIPYVVSSLVGAISKSMPPNLEPWPQVVERGFAALSVMAQSWENFVLEKIELNTSCELLLSGQATISRSFSSLLQQAWLVPMYSLEADKDRELLPPPSCIDHSSRLLQFIMLSVTGNNTILELKISELVLVWADLIADWHSWEESEDLSVFNCIKEVINLNNKYALKNFFVRPAPSPPAPPVPRRSIVENIGAFINHSISQYPSATWKACSCVHLLLNIRNPSYSFEAEGVKQSLAVAFSQTSFCSFREIQRKPSALWKPLLLSISMCYTCYPDIVEKILEKYDGGFTVWVSALGYVCSSSFEPGLSAESEIKLIVMALAKVVEQIMELGKPRNYFLFECFISFMEASIRLKEVQGAEEEEESDDNVEADNDDSDEMDDDEDSDDDGLEETEEEFLDRYAKAALDLENFNLIEEGEVEDQEHDIELGKYIDCMSDQKHKGFG